MPKKYKQKSLLTKPSSSAPSYLSLSKASIDPDASSTRTVNDLIRESRRENNNERPQTVSTTPSVPPSLRAVLDLPIPPLLPPRFGIRDPIRLRRIPGPPPPRSWLNDSVHASPKVKEKSWSEAHQRTRVQNQSSNLPEGNFPSDGSLQHVIMKSMAANWKWHAEYDHEYLAELPTILKQTLLSYIVIYSEGHGPNPSRLLFPADLSQDKRDEVRRLDFGNAIGSWSTLKKIEKELYGDRYGAVGQESNSSGRDVPDAWDKSEAMEIPSPAPTLGGGMRFMNLKHLSLAVVPETLGSAASWSGLLTLAGRLSTLTSLSLAHWPQPTYTPNASSNMIKVGGSSSRPTPTTYGGTNFYSAFDNDWREAAGMLRSLSRALYCLSWLDLTGCSSWFSALTWKPVGNEDDTSSRTIGPDWNGSWRGLEHLILAVGWSPSPSPNEERFELLGMSSITAPESSDRDIIHDMVTDLSSRWASVRLSDRSSDNPGPESWNVEFEREKYHYHQEVARHAAAQNLAKEVAHELRTIRKEYGGKWIHVDVGRSVEMCTSCEVK